jgi:hypothetical protein
VRPGDSNPSSRNNQAEPLDTRPLRCRGTSSQLRPFEQQTEMKTNDKVVCVYDTPFLIEYFDLPNGFVHQGDVYCVSGWSKCGGLILVGLPCIFKRTGEEAGFHPKRFRLLEEFRAELSDYATAAR